MAHDKVFGICNNKSMVDLLDVFHPIGSIYMSTEDRSPADLMGGEWESWGAGRVPVGVNASDSSFNTVEKTGGEKTHRLVTNEMPRHTHGIGRLLTIAKQAPTAGYNDPQIIDEYLRAQGRTAPEGYGMNHNNLQPYITCYMWKRIA